MFALCASSSLCPIQSFVCVTFFKNVQLPHQGYCVATHQYIYMCITTFEYTVCISTHSVVSRICVFAFESMANIYISLVNRWEKNDFWLNLKLTLRSQQNASFVIFELWYLWQLLHLNFFSTLNAHGYAQIRCSSHHLVSMGAVQVMGYTHLWVYIDFMDHEPKMFDRFRPNIRWICMRQVI